MDFEARFNSALTAYNRQDFQTARTQLEALELERPDDPQVLGGLIAVLRDSGAPALALAKAERRLKLEGEGAERLNRKARLLLLVDRAVDARAVAERAVELAIQEEDEIEQAHALALVGWAQHTVGQADAARTALTRALELDPNVVLDLPELEEKLAALGIVIEAE